VQQRDHPLLLCEEFATEPAQWIAGRAPSSGRFACAVKTRYRQADQACVVEVLPDGCCRVRTDVAQRAVTPGQSAVFYAGAECLGGAVIASVSAAVSRLESAQASGL
jgi:tRNA-specific 2-thiouridylase